MCMFLADSRSLSRVGIAQNSVLIKGTSLPAVNHAAFTILVVAGHNLKPFIMEDYQTHYLLRRVNGCCTH